MTPYSLYLHIPFCRQRCSYCDFNTYAGMNHLIPDYVTALGREAAWVRAAAGERRAVQTLYLGGGTPSLLPLAEMGRLWAYLEESFDLLPGLEASLEANPGTLTKAYLQGLRRMGFNRLSLGMQSAQADELALLGRQHDALAAIQAVGWGHAAGFENLSLDLIFGLPGQTAAAWERTLALALNLDPEHLSLYALTVEAGTPLEGWVRHGLIAAPDPDLAADLYELASERLAAAGYAQYEISNWAKPGDEARSMEPLSSPQPPSLPETGREGGVCSPFPDAGRRAGGDRGEVGDNPQLACRHNLQYWRNLPYLGLGAGAHGYAAGVRTANVLLPGDYLARLAHTGHATAAVDASSFPASPAAAQVTPIDREAEIGETMMMGLRLTREGVAAADFQARFGEALATHFSKPIERLTRLGLLEWAGEDRDRLRLTTRGRLLGNQVFVEFI